MMVQQTEILWNDEVVPGYFRMGLTCTQAFSTARPGQFVMLHTGSGRSPLLRRPFSLLGLLHERGRVTGVEILYRVVGSGTALLAQGRRGDRLSMLGPLGHAFTVPDACRRLILVAGGIGVPPIRFLANALLKRESPPEKCVVFIGGRTKDDLVCRTEFDLPGFLLDISTDDGSLGHVGLVTRSLERALDGDGADLICACGPVGMLKAVAAMAAARRIPCQVSIEAMMACGMGACLGCAVRASDDQARYLHVCSDGPVFDARRLKW